jgi:hypothetical protein
LGAIIHSIISDITEHIFKKGLCKGERKQFVNSTYHPVEAMMAHTGTAAVREVRVAQYRTQF